jgi:beta-xylosidase
VTDPRGTSAFTRLLTVLVSVAAIVGGLILVGAFAQMSEAVRAPKPTATSKPPPPTTQPPGVGDPSSPARIVTPGEDLPTPFVLVDQGWYFMYAYEGLFGRGGNLTVRVSPDFEHWGPRLDVLPVTPPWAIPTTVWAPDVQHIGDQYVLYFTARVQDRPSPTQCIGSATASSPLGPFTPVDQMLVCQLDRLGSIDPRGFVDADGARWLHWKSDDNADIDGTSHTSIYAQRLSADGLSLVDQPTIILNADQPWEGRIVEMAQMFLENGRYWLFYSGNWYNQPVYGIGVASCAGPAGPCTKPYPRPILGSNAQGAGPGEQSLFTDAKGTWMVYAPLAVDYQALTVRPVALARIGFTESGPYLAAL